MVSETMVGIPLLICQTLFISMWLW